MGLSLSLSLAPAIYCIFISLFLISHTHPSVASDALSPTQNLTDGQTLVSSNQRFELGFFNRGSSQNLYLGVWYHNHPNTVVWVANRNHPITGKSSCLTLSNNGTLFLYDGSTVVVWSNNLTVTANNPILQLLDSGNLVVREKQTDAGDTFIWESFDFITDTLLPGMKLGWKLRPRANRVMTSWKSNDDPSEGDFTFGLDSADAPQLVLSKDSEKQYRWGPWDGNRFSGSAQFKRNPVFIPIFVSNQEELYYTYQVLNDSIISMFVVTPQGLIQYLTLRIGEWVMMVTLNRDYCDKYRMCGPYGNCYPVDPNCKCLKGFTPTSPQDWSTVDWSDGCRRKHELKCGDGDGFVKYGGLKLPDHSAVWANQSHSAQECRRACLNKCECMAYTTINVTGDGPKCVVWLGDLLDLRSFPDGGEVIFIRMARAELESIADAKRKRRAVMIVVVVLCTLFGMILSAVFGYYICQLRKAKIKAGAQQNISLHRDSREENQDSNLELPIFDLDTIFAATDKFSSANKIGQGGFGPVYKGELPNGQEIAVKRLSLTSGQGLQQFKNEVVVIVKLQHRNLVRLLGCCIQGEERMLIYEYLPNKSLDNFIFDPSRRKLLPWRRRFNIIIGIARGLLYLHEDSRLRIIHRDLKASNILLDSDMHPKISDFGIARVFGGEQTEEKTRRVMGTFGYISPEYAMGGKFSVKSDVFSFGVLVLEIISGQKNWGFYHPEHDLNLVGHAWKLWSEENPLELMDKVLKDSFSWHEVRRCIQVGLLCVQQRPEDRLSMSSVVFMLSTESAEIPQPKEPGFYVQAFPFSNTDSSSGGQSSGTVNNVTITELGGR